MSDNIGLIGMNGQFQVLDQKWETLGDFTKINQIKMAIACYYDLIKLKFGSN